MKHLSGLAPLAERYRGFIVDLWGVVHDGVEPYPGAVDCLRRMRAAGCRVVLLSNAPRRVEAVRETLRRIGVPDDGYDGILTSGEATREVLSSRALPFLSGGARRMWHLGPERDAGLFAGIEGCEALPGPEGAEFVLNTGPDDEGGEDDPGPYLPALREAAARELPMLCANPDLEIVRGGQRIICAGLLARCYEEFGGRVHRIGKPFAPIYPPVLRMLGVPDAAVMAIGDALATDIAGARNAGLASCWVLGGIHAELVGADPVLAEREAAAAGLAPDATLPGLRW
ncbi:MAG: TIGR01459 family HAD-type hydrolase [Gluconacetobacter diazotrophicus]|nr:TIGR01459 family HAD-type hydrolase [Gluconacetobacter diazotrophicus]